MNESQNEKPYDLEERTFKFAQKSRDFVKKLPKTVANIEDGKQFIRSSGSQAANYIEANESETKKEFLYRIRLCRKETKESNLWLRLFEIGDNKELLIGQQELINEAIELRKIFNSIANKSK
jgi:four helix bundle protein